MVITCSKKNLSWSPAGAKESGSLGVFLGGASAKPTLLDSFTL